MKGIAALNRIVDKESLFNRCCSYIFKNRDLFPSFESLPQDIVEHLQTFNFPMSYGCLTCDNIFIYPNSDIKISNSFYFLKYLF